MDVQELGIQGAYLFTPRQIGDTRGMFLEAFKASTFEAATGESFELAQVNQSVSRRSVLRGIHFAQTPPGQAKYVTCTVGAIYDVVVDLRVGSPTFGKWEGVQLDTENRCALYLSTGLGHAFLGLADTNSVTYLCNSEYNPTAEHGIHPLDPQIDIDWPNAADALLSEKDAAAPSLKDVTSSGFLPTFAEWQRER
jgi:dTDP-4-dehydrorhamnose 3,5-epimerase